MTNTPSPTDEDRELIERARAWTVYDDADSIITPLTDRLESLLSDRAEALERAAENFDRLTVPHIVGNDVHNFAFQAAKLARAVLNKSTDRAT